jgi:hypothetical protein
LSPVSRFASILLLGVFTLLGSGALQHLHQLQHEREDALSARAADAAGQPQPAKPSHDDTTCGLHRLLHQPIDVVAWAPAEMKMGLLPLLLDSLTPSLPDQTSLRPADCRGPPTC